MAVSPFGTVSAVLVICFERLLDTPGVEPRPPANWTIGLGFLRHAKSTHLQKFGFCELVAKTNSTRKNDGFPPKFGDC